MIRLSALGDVVDCLPALDALRKALPSARIAWLVEDRCAGLLRGHPELDEVITVPRRQWAEGMRNPVAWPATVARMIAFYTGLRKRGFDAIFDFHGNLKSGLNVFLAGAPHRWGLAKGETREGNALFTNRKAASPPPGTHRVDRNLGLLRAAGLHVADVRFPLPHDEAARAKIRPFVEEMRLGSPRVVLCNPHQSPKGEYKKWPEASWITLAKRLRTELGVRPVVLWGPGEEDRARAVAEAAGASLAPETGLGELMELFRLSDLLVGSDSGPMHLAWALGLDVVALFGPKDPRVYGPYGGRGRTLYRSQDCSPCRDIRCSHVQCMKEISVEDVLSAVARALAESERTAAAETGGA
jgi:lipopolysaccharide heptosyltransferase I